MSSFGIEIAEWIPRDFGDPAERVSLAEIVIRVGGDAITEVEASEARTTREGIRVSAPALAGWLVSNWWRLRWEADGEDASWRMSHEIGAVGDGYLWPDATFVSSGSAIRVRARPIRHGSTRSLRFLNGVDADVPARDFENAVRNFVESVVSRMSSATEDADLSRAWRALTDEIDDPDASFRRAIEARMGFDPDEAPAGLLEYLHRASAEAGRDALGELAVSSGRRTRRDFNTLWRTARARSQPLHLEAPEKLRRAVARAKRSNPTPWKGGVSAARSARREWLPETAPLPTSDLAQPCGVAEGWVRAPAGDEGGPISAGFRDAEGSDRLSAALKKRHPTSRRFALARVIGDHLATGPRENLLPVTDSFTDRQKFQRAFAQELLCPVAALRKLLRSHPPDDEFIEDTAQRFEVSPFLVARALANNGLMGREALAA